MGLRFSNANKGTLGDIQAGWQVSEYATPVVPGDSSSSTNTCSYAGGYTEESLYLTDKSVTVTHVPEEPEMTGLGSLTGKIQSNSITGATVSISQSSLATGLNVDRTAQALTPGRVVGGRNIVAGASTYQLGAITSAVTSPDGRYVYIHATKDGSGSSVVESRTKYDMNTGKVVWKLAGQAAPQGTAQALNDGRLATFGTNASSSSLSLYNSDTGAFTSLVPIAIPTTALSNRQIQFSLTPDGNFLAFVSWWEAGSGTTKYARNRVFKFDITGAVILDSGIRTIATTTVDDANSAQYIVATQAMSLGDDTFLAYGPVVSGQTRYNAWGTYQLTAGAVTKIADFTQVSQGNTPPSAMDQYGRIVIGSSVYDSDGNLIYDYIDNIRSFAKRYDNTNGQAFFYPIGMTSSGNVTYLVSNYAYPLVVAGTGYNQASIGLYQVDTSVSLSDVFSYYFGLVFGQVFTYPINYQASNNPLVVLAGWNGNVWDHVCQLCVAFGVELVFLNGVPTVRDLGSTAIDISEYAVSPQLSPSVVGNARTVTLSYQQAKTVSNQATTSKTLTNLMANPTARIDATGYGLTTANGGTFTRSSGVVKTNQTSMKLTPTTKNYPMGTYKNGKMLGLSAGKSYTLRANVYKPASTAKSTYMDPNVVGRISVQFTDSKNGALLGATANVIPNAAGDYVAQVDFTVPAGAVNAYISFSGSNTRDTHFYNIRLTQKGLEAPGYKSNVYYDGNSKGWSWTGTANNSTSKLVTPGIPADNLIYDAYKDDNRTLTVDVQGSETTTIDVKAYLTTFDQPVQTDSLAFKAGTYYVSASDNLPVTAAQWKAYGGSVVVAQNPDSPSSLDITVIGPSRVIPGVAGPFSLSASDGQNNYAIFSITGVGVKVNEQLLTVHTGVDEDKITREDAGQIDNFAINSLADAWEMAYLLSEANSAATQDLSLSVPIARLSGFGLTPGARFLFNGNMYRINSCNIGNAMASISATRHVLVDDVISFYGDILVDDLIAVWDGYTCHDTVMRPFKPVG